MAFDFTIVTRFHFLLFLLAFAGVFFFIRARLQKKSGAAIARTGGELVLVITVLSMMIIVNHTLAVGLAVAGSLTYLVGRQDERSSLSPTIQLLAQACIVACLILFGWHIPFLTNPFSPGVLFLPDLFSPLVTLVFLLLLINAMNWIDGIDGLATGTGASAFVVLIFISLLPATQDTQTLGLAIIGLGATMAFYLWNISPAKAYLGTTGSWFLGLYIGLLAVLGGGKIATTLLVLAVPVLDALFVVVARLLKGKAIWLGDKQHHIHYRLQQAGLSSQGTVLMLVGISALLGVSAVLLQTHFKLVLLALVALVIGLFIVGLELVEWYNTK